MEKIEYEKRTAKLLDERQTLTDEIDNVVRVSKHKIGEIQTRAREQKAKVQAQMEAFMADEIDRRKRETRAMERRLSVIRHELADLRYQMFTAKRTEGGAL